MTIYWKAVEQCFLFFNFTQFVILENLSILGLALLGVKKLKDAPELVLTRNYSLYNREHKNCQGFCILISSVKFYSCYIDLFLI